MSCKSPTTLVSSYPDIFLSQQSSARTHLGGTLALHRNHRRCRQMGPSVPEAWPSPICYTVRRKFILEGFLPEKSAYHSCVSPWYKDLCCYLLSSWERLENVIWAGFGLSLHSHIITLKCRFIARFMYIFLLPSPPPHFTDTYTTCHVENINCWSYWHFPSF